MLTEAEKREKTHAHTALSVCIHSGGCLRSSIKKALLRYYIAHVFSLAHPLAISSLASAASPVNQKSWAEGCIARVFPLADNIERGRSLSWSSWFYWIAEANKSFEAEDNIARYVWPSWVSRLRSSFVFVLVIFLPYHRKGMCPSSCMF